MNNIFKNLMFVLAVAMCAIVTVKAANADYEKQMCEYITQTIQGNKAAKPEKSGKGTSSNIKKPDAKIIQQLLTDEVLSAIGKGSAGKILETLVTSGAWDVAKEFLSNTGFIAKIDDEDLQKAIKKVLSERKLEDKLEDKVNMAFKLWWIQIKRIFAGKRVANIAVGVVGLYCLNKVAKMFETGVNAHPLLWAVGGAIVSPCFQGLTTIAGSIFRQFVGLA